MIRCGLCHVYSVQGTRRTFWIIFGIAFDLPGHAIRNRNLHCDRLFLRRDFDIYLTVDIVLVIKDQDVLRCALPVRRVGEISCLSCGDDEFLPERFIPGAGPAEEDISVLMRCRYPYSLFLVRARILCQRRWGFICDPNAVIDVVVSDGVLGRGRYIPPRFNGGVLRKGISISDGIDHIADEPTRKRLL